MNNKLILDLTARLTQALDQNYDVVNMDTVLAVISALEGATITKEQLETTRLAKHINQLRRRNKSNILAIRAKNLLKKWREMVGITSQAQTDGASSATQQSQPSQQQVPKPSLSITSQPASPYTAQLLGENFDNSLSSIGGGVEFIKTATGSVSNTGSANFNINKKLTLGAASGETGGLITSSRSNGALTDAQIRGIKSTNRGIANKNIACLPASVPKSKHPTSFKNLITGFNAGSQVTSRPTTLSPLSPVLKVQPPTGESAAERLETIAKNNSTTYVINDDENQSQPSTTTRVAKTGPTSPRTPKSTKRKERDSPVVMVFMENSHSPLGFDKSGRGCSQNLRINDGSHAVTSIIDLQDSNSSSNFVNSLCEVAGINKTVISQNEGTASYSKKRTRKDKKRSNDMEELFAESEHFQPTIDESSRIAFPISGIQEYLSLSNSSMNIFPTQQTAGSAGAEGYPSIPGPNDVDQPLNSTTERNSEVVDGDLTFAGKFRQTHNSSSGIEVGSSSNYYSNGGRENMSAISSEFPCGNMKVAMNNCRDSVNVTRTASPPIFLRFSRNSNDSSSNSRTSQLDVIDVVNQDSQSMIAVDDLRQNQQSTNDKKKPQKEIESVNEQAPKPAKDSSNMTSKIYTKEQSKLTTLQRSINTSSKPSTPTNIPNAIVANTVSSLPTEQKIPKKRGRKKGSKGVDSVLAQSAALSSQFLMGPALGSSKKVKTTKELLADIQNRKLGSATSSPTLMNWFGTSRPASSCSEPSLHSPRTSDACSTNATMSTAARSTPEKNISNNSVAADELYESDSDSNTSEPSHDSFRMPVTSGLVKSSQSKILPGESSTATEQIISTPSIEEQIREIMALLPPVQEVDMEAYEDVPCTCTLREIPPEIIKKDPSANEVNENGLNLTGTVTGDDEPIISVSVRPLGLEKPPNKKTWSPNAPHSQSAPVSAVTSPVVPSTNPKPLKSIFDLDFDDENDPMHTFVEAASKTTNLTESPPNTENGRIPSDDSPMTKARTVQSKDDSQVAISQRMQSEFIQQTVSPEQPPPALPLSQSGNVEIMPSYFDFPTYEVVEDSECQAKIRYEIQTNQITKFHINAFHNCFIPNVNGNWDHSVPQNLDEDCHQIKNDGLYSNVVPRYGCFFTERIPKDLSHVRFTKNFKPKNTKNSIKPPQPFLGVANIIRRQHFRSHHHRRLKHKRTTTKHKKQSKTSKLKTGNKLRKKKTHNEQKVCKTFNSLEIQISADIPVPLSVKREDNDVKPLSPIIPTTNHNILEQSSSRDDKPESKDKTDESLCDLIEYSVLSYQSDSKKPIANGTIHRLMNNNSIVHCSDETKSEGTKLTLNNLLIGGVTDSLYGIAASRRSSSCSNSSLKQNQNSINMKLRMHRLQQQQQQQEKQRQRHKRKHLSSFTNALEFGKDESAERTKVPPLIKRIKIVNGEYRPSAKSSPNINNDSNCLDDEVDSDCCHVHSENDIITEEEIDDDCDDRIIRDGDEEDDYEDLPDDFDEEDGDDEEDAEEDYGDFHEVVTRDMTSSTTGNNHIVLTIKKTPSKTNSPSSSSMSPAPALNSNIAKLPSNNPTAESSLSYLLEDNATELPTKNETSYEENNKHKLENIIELSSKESKGGLFDKFFWSEPAQVTVLNFQLKKNGDNDLEKGDNDGEEAEEGRHGENDRHEEENSMTVLPEDNADKKNINEKITMESESVAIKNVTETELNESLQLVKKRVRRLKLKARLQQGIEVAHKLHRELFFPYELRTSIGSKILEISSCTSDCTDPSDDETDSSNNETTSSSSSSGTNGIKSRVLLKRRRLTKLSSKKNKTSAAGGGGPPSSSSSSSSSNSSSSSSRSYSSWTTTSSSSDSEHEKAMVKKKELNDEKNSSSDNNSERKQDEEEPLPSENNFLLRTFNHIYISTEERRRQQQLKQEVDRHHHEENMNTGYITLSGDDTKDDETQAVSRPPGPNDNCDAYINYYNYSPNLKIYNATNSGNNILSSNNTAVSTDPISVNQPSTSQTMKLSSTFDSKPSAEQPPARTIETKSEESSSKVIPSTETSTKISTAESSSIEDTKTNDNSNSRINPDSSIGSNYNNNNNQSSVQLNNKTEQEELIPQEEYRTGLRKVDEDVDDEDGNNCARTQQFKEWHEVLQLRSYNDELLTVLPYVVIE